MAAVIARHLGQECGLADAEFRSAGTSTIPGLPASEGALRAAHLHGLELSDHASTPLSGALIDWADIILTMGTSHLIWVTDQGGEGKSALLGSFLTKEGSGAGEATVQDPFGGGDQVYEATFLQLESMVAAALRHVSGEVSR